MDEASRGTVAVIVIHGVANQVRGETAAAVAAQLATADGAGVTRSDIAVATPTLKAAGQYKRKDDSTAGARMSKSLKQSLRSDFLEAQGVEQVARSNSAPDGTAPDAARADAGADTDADAGALYTDYLIAKAMPADSDGPKDYEMPCFEVRGNRRKLDVFEMYWADLSNLQGFVTRIAAELFYILFHLSKLGADTVSLAARLNPANKSLQVAARSQRWADWMFSRLLAMLSLQLVVCMLLLVPRALFDGNPAALAAAFAVAGLICAAVMVYLHRPASWAMAFWCAIVPAGVLALVAMYPAWTPPGLLPSVFEVVWLLVVVLLHDAFLRFAEERFKAVLGVGRIALALTVTFFVGGAASGNWAWTAWSTGALVALEAILFGYAAVWISLACAIAIMAVAAGLSTRDKDTATASRVRQSLVTGHLGLYVSLGAFLAAVMTLWGVLSATITRLVDQMRYAPLWFKDGCTIYCAQSVAKPDICTNPGSAACFVEGRYTASTMGFAPLVVVLLVLLGFALIAFLPSVLVEIRAYKAFAANRLGSWLTKGYRSMERLIQGWSVVAALLAFGFALALLDSQLIRAHVYAGNAGGWVGELRAWLTDRAGSTSAQLLQGVVYAFTGGAIGLAALGSVTIKRIRAIRAPLDAALDVDKHFREFPRKEIIRVQILERYVALLAKIKAMGYEKIVIVAHSQGTVITADLLRYIQQRRLIPTPGTRLGAADPFESLRTWLGKIDARLFTVGSPLRQLYANRFPWMYSWVLDDAPGALGPAPGPLGMSRWINLWGCGDYVGRWLWSPAGTDQPQAFREMAGSYASHTQFPPPGGPTTDMSIGTDAHTHYFDLDQRLVAKELSKLIP